MKGVGCMEQKIIASIAGAEILLIRGMDLALAFKYAPGQTPILLAKGRKREAGRLIWAAQEMGIPIVENMALEMEMYPHIEVGEEISEKYYRPVAYALAILYKTKPSSNFVRYIRLRSRKKSVLKESAEALASEMAPSLRVSPVSVELGSALMEREGLITEALASLRQRVALDLGLILPPVEVRLNSHIRENAYLLKIKEVPSGEGEMEIAVNSTEDFLPLLNKLKQAIHFRAPELLGYHETEALLENYRRTNPGLVKELFPVHFSVPALRLILRNLLREHVSIRDMGTILEGILEHLDRTNDPDLLTEYVRTSFAFYLCQKYQGLEGQINVLLLSPEVEEKILGSLQETAGVRWLSLSPEDALTILTAIGGQLERTASLGYYPVILSSPSLRRFLRRLVESSFPTLPVLSYNEITPLADIRSVGTISFPQVSAL